jgi:hypothetical protein
MIKVHPHLKLEAYRGPHTVEFLLFHTTSEIKCLRSWVGNMIGCGVHYVPSLEEKYKDLCVHDLCYLVLCSETYAVPPKNCILSASV